MKAVFLDHRHVWLEEVEEPSIQLPTDVKVKVCYASICGYDMMVYRGEASPSPGFVVGHETSGVVVDIGRRVTGISIGDPVAFKLFLPCGYCTMCRNNMPSYCLYVGSFSMQMREYMVCPQDLLQPLGNQISLKAGCQIEPLTMGMCCLNKANLAYGKTMLILGGGAMGLLILKLATMSSVSKIVVADPHPEKRDMALKFGASAVFDPRLSDFFNQLMDYTGGLGFDNVVEASGSRSSARLAFHLLARGGHLIYYGLYGMNYELPLNLFNLYWKDAYVSAVYPSTTIFQQAADIAPRMTLEDLITAEYPYEQAADAFAEKATGKHAKVVLDFTDNRFR
jgi:2-desacetyl-2-hydroxyethyl bacteriochlorophyllide A dehydrogenase